MTRTGWMGRWNRGSEKETERMESNRMPVESRRGFPALVPFAATIISKPTLPQYTHTLLSPLLPFPLNFENTSSHLAELELSSHLMASSDLSVPIFVDTSLHTYLAIAVSPHCSVASLKTTFEAQHLVSFPALGPVLTKALTVALSFSLSLSLSSLLFSSLA